MLAVNKSVGNNYSCENFNETKQDPIEIFPDELVLEVFSRLNLATLGTICCVSKSWKRLANEPILWKIAIYREIAFGNDKWAQCFGTDVVKNEDNREELFSLPSDDFIADCKKFKSIFPERNAKDRLMLVRLPKTLNGGLTLKSLGELAKKYFSASNTGYQFIWPVLFREQGDKSIDKSQWVVMTKDVLPGSRNKSYDEQQKIVSDLAEKSLINYEVPETLKAVACILSQYFDSNIRLFSNNPCNYTRCKVVIPAGTQGAEVLTSENSPLSNLSEGQMRDLDNDRQNSDQKATNDQLASISKPAAYSSAGIGCKEVQGYQTVVSFAPAGLDIISDNYGNDDIGVAVLRKF